MKGYSRNITKACCILAAAAMTFSSAVMFTGCSGKNGGNGGNGGIGGGNSAASDAAVQEQVQKTLAYTVNTMRVNNNISGEVTYKNGLLYTSVYTYKEEDGNYTSTSSVIVFDENGTIVNSIPVFVQDKANEYGGIQGGIQVDDNGNFTCMIYKGSWDEATGESTSSQQLMTFDKAGNQVGTIDLDNVVTQEDQDQGRYFNNYVLDKNGNIYINLSSCIRVCDKTGNVIFTTEPINQENTWMNSLILLNSGVPAVSVFDYSNEKSSSKLVEIDFEKKGYGKEYAISGNMYNLYDGSGDYLCYSSGDTGIIGVRADNLTSEPVINLLNLGVDSSQMNTFNICDDGSFLTTGYDWNGSESATVLSFIKKEEQEKKVEKTIINLGCFSLDWNLRSAVAEFNKNNDKYLINVQSYADTNDTSDYTSSLTKFNNELMAGNIPDIICLNEGMPYDSYVSKGLFADMYSLIEADPDLTKDSFMPNVLKALEKNGKLYSLATSFNVQSYAAKKSLVGDNAVLSVSKANEILASMPEGAQFFNYPMSRADFVSTAVQFSDYVDYANASCNFDNDEFKAVLEVAKTLPEEIDYEALYNDNPNYWMEQETACRDNKALLYNAYFYDFESYYRVEKGYFGEEIAMIGFPGCKEGSGSLLNLQTQLAVSSKSKNQDGAWAFIKYVLDKGLTEQKQYPYTEETSSPDYAVGSSILMSSTENNGKCITRYVNNNGALPVLVDQIEKLADQATKPNSYFDGDGNIIEEENSYWIGDQEIKMGTMTKADTDKVLDYFKTVEKLYKYDASVHDIVNEEAAEFFNGTKSADETASIIQSRVSIYMSEQY